MTLDVEDLKRKYKRWELNRSQLLKFRILLRDDFKCVKCGRDSELTIAHIKPVRKLRCSRKASFYVPNNTITLCSDCHILADECDWDLSVYRQI